MTTKELKITKCQSLDIVTALKINRKATADRALTMTIAETPEAIFFCYPVQLTSLN